MSNKYYLTKDTCDTFEEMSLYELGRQLLTYDGAEIQIDVEFTFLHRKPIGGGNFGDRDEVHDGHCHFQNEALDSFQDQEAYKAVREEAKDILIEHFALEFIAEGSCEGWLNIPDSVRAFDEEGYKEELKLWGKENADEK